MIQSRVRALPAWKDNSVGIVAWVLLGAIAGYVASIITGDREGLLGTIILGVVGGLLGGFAASEIFHRGSVNGLNAESVLIAIAGAVIVVLAWRRLVPRRTGRLRF